jgi:outer membrane protein assembly factor BamB
MMLRRLLKLFSIAVILLAVTGAVLYAFFGLRLVFNGGGGPRLGFVRSADEQADIVARHREAQRATAPPAAIAPEPVAPPVPPSGATVPAEPPTSADAVKPVAADPGFATWTDFRGPARDGRYRGPIRTNWPAGGLQPMWNQPVGGGYASFTAARGRAYTIEQRGPQEVVAAYDVMTGRELWAQGWTAMFRETMGGDGPRATPTWHDGRLYALGATGQLVCLDATNGRVIWRVDILEDAGAENLAWGMAASPLIVDDTVIVLPGGPGGKSVAAYHKHDGRRVWSAHDDQAAYSSPMLVTRAGVRHVIVFTATRVMGLAPDSGRLLWQYPWPTQMGINASQPIVIGDNRVFVSTGYGTGATVIELSPEPGAASDGGQAAPRLSVREVWRNIRMKNQFTSSVLHDGYIYGLDENILACVDAATGDLKWKGGRYGYGQVMLASGHLIVLSESGELALVRATPDGHDERVRFPAIAGKTWNHPVIVDGILLIRNLQEMAAFDLRLR